MAEPRKGEFPVAPLDPSAVPAVAPFFAAALEGRLSVPRCTACGTFVLPPQPFCFQCQGQSFAWTELAGTGTIYSYTVVRHPLHPRLEAVVPYVSAVIELDGTQGAGARMLANVTDCDPDQVRIGDRVKIRFDRVTDRYAVPRFSPLRD